MNKLNNINLNKTVFFVLAFSLFCFFCGNVYAQEDTENQIINELQVIGNKSLSGSAILAKVKVRVGDEISQDVLNEDIKRLYATGYFENVKVTIEPLGEGQKVVFQVEEKPVLKEITLKGNTVLDNKSIMRAISSETESFLNPRILKLDIAKIRQLYVEKGFTEVAVNYDINIEKETNKAVVDIIIKEGAKLKVSKITLEGVNSFKEKRILKLIQTRRDTLFTSGIFRENVLKEDIVRIESFYISEGFLDAKAAYFLSEIDNKNRLSINIKVEEGKKYITGNVQITGNKKFSSEDIEKTLQMKQADTFTHQRLKMDVANIQSFYFERGHIFANVTADTMLDPGTGRIDVKYTISEGEIAYIDRINIEGNTKTKDIVIRRELRVYPGEEFDGKKLRRSKERLDRLGIFQSVNFDTEQGNTPDKKDLIVEVKEAKTGEFSFGAGYSSVDEAVGFVELRQNNFDWRNWPSFTGDAQQISIRAELGTVKEDYDLSFTEPWIFDKPISFGFDVFQRSRDRERDIGYAYDQRNRGGNLRLGKEFTEFIKGYATYRYEDIKIDNLEDDVSADLAAEEGENSISSLKFGVERDTRNSIYNPTEGMISYFSIETAGSFLGADKDFMRYMAGSSWYYNFFKDHVLELKLRAGIVDAFGDSDKVPIYERFFAGGGSTIRGYDSRDVGPKDLVSLDPIGGESMLVGNIEYSVPIIKNFTGAVFFDAGNVWEKVSDFGQDYEYSVGTGIRIKTPIGPVKLDYGYPLDGDSNGKVHFSMGKMF